jgi:2-iminoacetate synthase
MMINNTKNQFINVIDEDQIQKILATSLADAATMVPAPIHAILDKARALQGLTLTEAAALIAVKDPQLQKEIFATARQVKYDIYGSRIVLFAPLYISNLCSNDCLYCAFRSANKALVRRTLQQNEIVAETKALLKQGHKRLLLVAGETYPNNDFTYVTEAIKNIYAAELDYARGNNTATAPAIAAPNTATTPAKIRRINVNLAPLTMEEFQALKQCNIGTYQLFQETYHQATYRKVHLSGKKADYAWRLNAMDRAMQAGIDDIGLGALFGLADWRFELLALLQHAEHLQKEYGAGPHTISVPRLEPALGSELASRPLSPVSDEDFCKLVAILRLAVPYTGIIMSTRETPELRRLTLTLGVSQISAGSCTNPGGYSDADAILNTTNSDSNTNNAGQFTLGDHRQLDEIVNDIAALGHIPSFCTACYRSGRTGEDFMCLAKPGEIKHMCRPNALLTFQEYLIDHASPATRAVGEQLIQKELAALPPQQRTAITRLLDDLRAGKRDLFV